MTALPPLEMIDAVLFDAGETLIFIRPSFVGGYVIVCHEAGIDVDEETLQPGLLCATAAMEARSHGKRDLRTDEATEFALWIEFNRLVFEAIGHPEVDPLDLSRRMETAYASGRLTSPEPDTLPTLERLRAAGLKIGIVSNASGAMAKVLDHSGISPLVDWISISALVGWEKPAPEIFQHCLDGLGVAPGRAIHVGDSLGADAQGAEAAGLAGFVHFANGIRCDGEHGGVTIQRLSDLPGLLGMG